MLQNKSKKILLYLFLFLLIGTLNNKDLNKFDFGKISKINIIGLDKENKYELINDLNFLKMKNLFFLNKSHIIEIVKSNDLVEKFSVFRKYPSTLNIEIDEIDYLAKLNKDGEFFFLGSNGKLIKKDYIEKKIPFIFGNFNNQNFFDLKKAIDQTNFEYSEIKNLFSFKSGRWDIETNSGVLIKLPYKNIKESLELFQNIKEKDKKKIITKIDLRQSNQIIIND